jgi:uncharacterized membrane protein (UPF0127 family)/CheY-like chemotaxis protein
LTTETKLIVNVTREQCLCVGELADRPLLRMRGLIGRRGLPAGEGLLLRPAPSIHTAFMRFPIDVLFLDRDLRVLDVVECLQPWRLASRRRARAVLELAAGEAARRGVQIGDRLTLRDRRPVEDAGPMVERVPIREPESVIWPASLKQSREFARLQPIRVLVISRDRYFRSVTSMLLSHRGCSVTATAHAGRVTELIERDGADVIVIDAGHATDAARSAAEAAAVARSVGIVVVDDSPSDSQAPPVIAKWGPFEELFAAIEAADEHPGDWRRDLVRG